MAIVIGSIGRGEQPPLQEERRFRAHPADDADAGRGHDQVAVCQRASKSKAAL